MREIYKHWKVTMSDIVCPKCNKDDAIQKVSAVVAGGTATGSFSGFSGGVVNLEGKTGNVGGYNTLSGGTISNLARLLAPPAEPSKPSSTDFLFLIILIVWVSVTIGFCISGVLTLFFIGSDFRLFSIAGIVILVILSAFGLFRLLEYHSRVNEKNQKAKQEYYQNKKLMWEKSMKRWNDLYYCHRDGIVFDPKTGENCEPDNMNEFIFRQT
jgi:hypothetical protein